MPNTQQRQGKSGTDVPLALPEIVRCVMMHRAEVTESEVRYITDALLDMDPRLTLVITKVPDGVQMWVEAPITYRAAGEIAASQRRSLLRLLRDGISRAYCDSLYDTSHDRIQAAPLGLADDAGKRQVISIQ